MDTNFLHRTLVISLLLHGAALLFVVNLAVTGKERPVVVELSLSQWSGGSEGGPAEIPAEKGRNAASAAGAQSPQSTAASPQKSTSMPAAVTAPAVTRVGEQLPHLAPRPAPTAPMPNAPVQQAASAGPAAGKPGTEGTKRPGPAVGEPGKSGQGGGFGQRGGGSGNGSGSGVGAGNSLEQLQKKYVSDNFAYIMKIIQDRIVYPPKARREGLSGKAYVSFFVKENGEVADIRLLHSTGYEVLDLNLIKAIKDAAPFPRPPIKAELRMPFTYRLER